MNFIFDIGNVLVDFKPEEFLRSVLNNPQAEKIVNETIFKSTEWIMLDAGTITPEQACVNFCDREPEYKEYIVEVMEKLPLMLTPIRETIDLLPEIKRRGHKLYYLSNYHTDLSRYIQEKYPFFDLLDGGVFSCDVHMLKPSKEIYIHLLEKYSLKAEDCVFFDDTLENVEAAKNLGIKGVLFIAANQAKDFIESVV